MEHSKSVSYKYIGMCKKLKVYKCLVNKTCLQQFSHFLLRYSKHCIILGQVLVLQKCALFTRINTHTYINQATNNGEQDV